MNRIYWMVEARLIQVDEGDKVTFKLNSFDKTRGDKTAVENTTL